jgi:hypothetical protein
MRGRKNEWASDIGGMMGTSFASKGSTNLTQRVKNKRAQPLEKGVRQGNGQSVCSLV